MKTARLTGLVLATLCGAVVRAQAPVDSDEQRIADLVASNHILFDQGVLDGFGHVSVRSLKNPSHFFMSQSRAPGLVTREDIMEFDQDAKPIDQRGRPLYGERAIHAEILRARPDVQAVVHSHSPAVIPYGFPGHALGPLIHTAGFLPATTPIFEIRDAAGPDNNILVTESKTGAALARTLGSAPVVLMRGHGMSVVGPSVRHAVYRAVYTQLDAQVETQSLLLGQQLIFLNPMESAKTDAVNEGDLFSASPRRWALLEAEADLHTSQLLPHAKR